MPLHAHASGGQLQSGDPLIGKGAVLRQKYLCSASARVIFWCDRLRFRFAEAARKLGIKIWTSLWKRREKVISLLQKREPRELAFRFIPRLAVPELFDEQFYQSQFMHWRSGPLTPLEHYLENGWKRGYNPHPLFDAAWYLEHNPEVKRSGREPLGHFLEFGWREGRNPNPLFHIEYYLGENPEVAGRRENPLLHYLQTGWKQGRNPGPHFSISKYRSVFPELDPTVEPLGHFLSNVDGSDLENRTEYRGWPLVRIPTGIDPLPVEKFGKVAVQLHAFYVDKLDFIFGYLKNIPCRFDLLVSTNTDENACEVEKKAAEMKLNCGLDIRIAGNRGRDVAPLVCTFGGKLLEYDCALHVHTKKSVHVRTSSIDYGQRWLAHNVKYLACDEVYVREALSLLANPECGVLVPKPWKGVRQVITWAKNRVLSEQLMERLGLPASILDSRPVMFPAGTMFWFKPGALKPLLASDLTYDDFPPEPLPLDGTLAHGIERCICYIALAQGYQSRVIAPSVDPQPFSV